MIARFDGRCSICNRPIRKGEDVHYSAEEKTVEHWDCRENPQPTAQEYELADRIGYRAIGWDQILRILHGANDCGRSEGDESAALRRHTLRELQPGDGGEE